MKFPSISSPAGIGIFLLPFSPFIEFIVISALNSQSLLLISTPEGQNGNQNIEEEKIHKIADK
jgi:hypothetical protein